MKDLLVVVPSRSRPHNVMRLVRAMQDTCREQTDVLIGLDASDPWPAQPGAAHGYPPAVGDISDTGLIQPRYEIRDGLKLAVPWMNALATGNTFGYAAIGYMGDDSLPRTEGWDTQVMLGLAKTPFAFARDNYPREPGTMSSHIFARSAVVARLGYLAPPRFRHAMVNVVWQVWGQACGIAWLQEAVIEDMHHSCGKAMMDQTYLRAQPALMEDLVSYHAYCQRGVWDDIAAIRSVAGDGPSFTADDLIKFNRHLGIRPVWPPS